MYSIEQAHRKGCRIDKVFRTIIIGKVVGFITNQNSGGEEGEKRKPVGTFYFQ